MSFQQAFQFPNEGENSLYVIKNINGNKYLFIFIIFLIIDPIK